MNCPGWIRKLLIFIAYTFCLLPISWSQDTISPQLLPPVVITSYKDKPIEKTSLSLISLQLDSLNHYADYNLTDLIARIPGVTMLSTGPAISKPVIRGLYGNRILVLLSGLKFDNQQWQEEHGLGLSGIGLGKVELIKGPLSILYGTEAIGGIINLIEENKPEVYQSITDFKIQMNSNSLGALLQAGYKKNNGNDWFRCRIGLENHADYSDGNHQRVLNSRSDGYYLKSTYGFSKKNWTSTNNYMSSYNRFGFIFNDIYTFFTPDARWSRDLSVNPDHLVLLNIVSSENKFTLRDESILHFNAGIQSNSRRENEGGGAISLNMHLLTFQYLVKWEKQFSSINRMIISNLGSLENNTNYGARKIVPDARMQESNISMYFESTLQQKIILENGIGAGEKWIKTFFTTSVNGPDKEIHPFHTFSPYYNIFSGISYLPNEKLSFKANLATGVRIANLAELSSNGLHEGIFTYEIGNPNLKNEQNICFNIYSHYKSNGLQVSISPFYNVFNHYIYLAPTQEDWFGFPVYRYRQQSAWQYGGEAEVSLHQSSWKEEVSFSYMNSKTKDGNYTPYIPAAKISPGIQKNIGVNFNHNLHLYSSLDYYFDQHHTAPFEISTPAYVLWNAGGQLNWTLGSKKYFLSLSGNNLLNIAYYDHLSRFKNFGLLNIGRNIMIDFKVQWGHQQ
ncbi:MAG: TonB-dependent receptor [Saprospiraceae bacterium]